MSSEVLLRPYGTRLLLLLAYCVSMAISWLEIHTTHALSPDSLLYISTAQTFLDHGLPAAIESYPWPFFSLLIAGIHQLTGLSLVISGHLFIAALYAGLSGAFILLVRDLGGSTRTLLLALLIISIFPTLNDYRGYITRDAGFWLFILLSLQQLLRFALKDHLRHAIGWFLLVIAAIAFRTEALFFAALAPLALFTDTQFSLKQRFKKSAILYGLFICAALLGLIVLLSSPQLSEKIRLVTELSNLPAFFRSLALEFKQTVEAFANIAPHEFAANDMGAIITTGLIGLVIYTFVHALTPPYLILLCLPAKQTLFSEPGQKRYLIAYLLIIALYLVLLSFKKYFMTDRFCIMAALIAMLAIPFCIERAWQHSHGKFGWRRIIIVCLLLVPALDSLINSGNSKEYIAQASQWVQQNNPSQERILTNHQQIAVLGANCHKKCWFRNHSSLIKQAKKSCPGLLAINLKEEETDQRKEIQVLAATEGWTLIQSFSNEKDDRVLIWSCAPLTGDLSQ